MKTLLSLFDYSGEWSAPFYRNGWNVIQWDIKITDFMDVNDIGSVEEALDLFEDVDGILIAVPCNEFTAAGAQYWPAKDEDGRTEAAKRLVSQSLKLVDLFKPTDPDYDGTFFWALENPVGRIGSIFPELGKPWFFNPCDYAGYLKPSRSILERLDKIRAKNGLGVTKEEADLVVTWSAYNKKTGIWGDCIKPAVRRIEPVKCAPQGSFTQRLGGNRTKTKEERSITPAGFAEAFYQANKDYKGAWFDDLND